MTEQELLEDRARRVPEMPPSGIFPDPERRHEPDGIGYLPAQATPTPSKREVQTGRVSVLTEAQGLVHGDRNVSYGSPRSDYSRTAGMASAMLAHKLREPLTAADLIQIMICVKLSRQTHRPKRDNCTDGAGYFECLQWVLDEEAGLA